MIKKNKIALLLGITLFVASFSLYWQTRNFDFIDYDDREYIHNNGVVTNGLSIASVKWAFGPEQCRQMSNWHPVTTLSWMLDVSLFGVNAGAMHLHNGFVHSVNGVLLFIFLLMLLRCMGQTGKARVSDPAPACSTYAKTPPADRSESDALPLYIAAFIGAAFWAWHPLRAESVAWISSRKDVLSILFLLPGLMAYLKALRGDGKRWLFVSGVCYLFAYFSKPTAVVYPLLAAMLEYVVTRRISWRQNELLVYLMGVLMVVTFIVQDVGGATVMLLPLTLRLENAVAGLGHYVTTTLWPSNLSILYKYEVPVPFDRFIAGAIFLLSAFWFWLDMIVPRIKQYWKGRHIERSQQIYSVDLAMMIAVGLFWFCICLGPVLGFVQVGFAACADRYTYLSSVGFSIILAMVAQFLQTHVAKVKIAKRRSSFFALFCSLSTVFLVFFAVLAFRYISRWNNTKTVFDQAIRATQENYIAYWNAGICELEEKKYDNALNYLSEGAKYMFMEIERKRIITPYKDAIAANLAVVFSILEGAGFEKTVAGMKPKSDVVLSTKVKTDDPLAAKKIFAQGLYAYWKELDSLAIQYFDEAIKLVPLDDYLWRFKGYSLERRGFKEEALVAFKRSYALKPAKDIQKRIKALEQAIATGDGR